MDFKALTAEKRIESMTRVGAIVKVECRPKIRFGEGGILRGKQEIVGTFWHVTVDVKGAFGKVEFHFSGTGETIDSAIDEAFSQPSLEEIIDAFSVASGFSGT